jgi:hypothetical protein|tara:strand:+ start:91 stop:720 length:630 start_codon:yes stop_codon:yes gene_type:complete
MPIFHHNQTGEKFFFIHIPRTAGRFLSTNFLRNHYSVEHHLTKERVKDLDNYLTSVWIPEKIEILHSHYPVYSKWKSVKDLSSIAIVRNPIDRFFSASGVYAQVASQSSFEDWTTCKNIFSKHRLIDVANWWRPQHEFVSPHTKIWKYEDGFGEKFCEWINKILPVHFSIKTHVYDKREYDQAPGLIKTKALTDNIKKFYHQDFDKFNY